MKNPKITIKVCKHHGETEFVVGRKYKYSRCRKCVAIQDEKLREKKRQQAFNYKGNKCLICGYDKCTAALEFHHLVKETKLFAVGRCFTRKWEILKSELDKCILVCSNCHREIHHGNLSVTDYLPSDSESEISKSVDVDA